jgi:leucyl-tRNA synthetase
MLAPFTPHVCEEMWEHLGYEGSVHDMSWPTYDEKALVKDTVEIVVQINGKIKEKLNIAGDLSREEMEAIAMADESVKTLIEGKNVVKVIAVPNKLINIVVK